MKIRQLSPAAKITSAYVLVGGAWILLSDLLVGSVLNLPGSVFLNVFKGLAFVGVTATLLFVLLRRVFQAESAARIAAEKSTQASRELQIAAEHSRDLFYRYDTSDRLTFVSPQCMAISGYTREELKVRWTSLATNNPINQAAREISRTAMRTGIKHPPYHVELRKKDGTPLLLEVSESPILDPAGKVIAMAGAARDVTERERAITALRKSEKELLVLNRVYSLTSEINQAIVRINDRETLWQEACRIAVEHGGFRFAWIGMMDAESGQIHPVARAGREDGYLDAVHLSAWDEPHGQGPAGRAIREDRAILCEDTEQDPSVALWRNVMLAHEFRSLVCLPLRRNGAAVGILAAYASERGMFAPLVRHALDEMAADISFALDRFEQQRQREKEQQQLRLQHSALEAAANAVLITDNRGNVEWVNAAFTKVTGYSRDEIVGSTPRLLRSGKHDPQFYERMWKSILSGRVWQGSMTNRRKDGSEYFEEMTITPVHTENGEISHFIAIKQDITDRLKLEQQFLRSQRMESIGLLAGGIAHDLNNVLAPVFIALPLLREDLAAAERAHLVEMLDQSVRRGASIIKQVLTFARGVDVQRTPVQLRHLIKEMVKVAEETFPRDIQISSALPADLWPFVGDPTQIHQVFLNLALNARDAMPEGGRLAFSAQNVELKEPFQFHSFEIPAGRYVVGRVSDTGTGIPPESLERIFEPFFTTKPQGKGTGLGLSTVLGIVKSHGGLVQVESTPGLGSSFVIFLPAAEPSGAEGRLNDATAPSWRGTGETILIVDDEAVVAQVSTSVLTTNGYEVITANNGAEGLKQLHAHRTRIRAVVTDIMMPQMDGVTFTRELKGITPSVPVIVTTGLMSKSGAQDHINELRDLGVTYFLEKPYRAEQILELLAEIFQGGRKNLK